MLAFLGKNGLFLVSLSNSRVKNKVEAEVLINGVLNGNEVITGQADDRLSNNKINEETKSSRRAKFVAGVECASVTYTSPPVIFSPVTSVLDWR